MKVTKASVLACVVVWLSDRMAFAEEFPVFCALASVGTFDGVAVGATLRGKNSALLATVAFAPSIILYQYKHESAWALPTFRVEGNATFTLGGSVVVSTTRKHADSLMFGGRWSGLLGPGLWAGVQRRMQLSARVGLLMYGGSTIFASARDGLRTVLEPGSRVFPLGTVVTLGGNFGIEYALF